MAAPLFTNPIWIYGSDDDTLFRLIVLGTLELQKRGSPEKGRSVVGPMPPFGDTIRPTMISGRSIAWIRSVNPSR